MIMKISGMITCILHATDTPVGVIAIYAPMIYVAPCIMFWMRAYALQGQVGGGWALEIESSMGPVKWHRADRRAPFGAQKTRLRHFSQKSLNGLHYEKVTTRFCPPRKKIFKIESAFIPSHVATLK